jgi:putative ABC transport system substrate-binding protein
MSYGPSLADLRRRAASNIDRILKGAQPGDFPVEQPTTFELVISLKMARALGLTMPPSVLFQATDVLRYVAMPGVVTTRVMWQMKSVTSIGMIRG